jgi:putative protein kinase ArgK-like GTPase of G3E family
MWVPEVIAAMPQKKYEHRALEDIKESIEELRYYREHLWKIPLVEINGEKGEGVAEITDNVASTSI